MCSYKYIKTQNQPDNYIYTLIDRDIATVLAKHLRGKTFVVGIENVHSWENVQMFVVAA